MPSTYAHRRFGANVLDHLPAPLREKLEPDPANPVYIMTKWGVGYYFKGEEQPTV